MAGVFDSYTLESVIGHLRAAFGNKQSPQAMGYIKLDQIKGESTRGGGGTIDFIYFRDTKSWDSSSGYTTMQKDGLAGAVQMVPYLFGCQYSSATPQLAKHTAKGTKLASAEITITSGSDYPPLVIKLDPAVKLAFHMILEPALGSRPLELFALIAGKTTWTVDSTSTDYTWTDPTA
jgi:type VI protein secretion system component Hcp